MVNHVKYANTCIGFHTYYDFLACLICLSHVLGELEKHIFIMCFLGGYVCMYECDEH